MVMKILIGEILLAKLPTSLSESANTDLNKSILSPILSSSFLSSPELVPAGVSRDKVMLSRDGVEGALSGCWVTARGSLTSADDPT